MLATLVRTRRPDRMVCALDHDWRPGLAGRAGAVVQGAPGRPGGGEVCRTTLDPQVPVMLEVLDAVGITAVGAAGYEADDVLGTLAATQPGPVEVVSGDRDLFQLVDDAKPVRLLYCGRGVAKLEDCDDAAVASSTACRPRRYADFAAMRGDPSDGLPGVPGVGEKTAARLIARYGGVAGDPGRARRPGDRLRAGPARQAGRRSDYLGVALPVCRVALDVPLPDFDRRCRPRRPTRTGCSRSPEWNLAGSARRLVDALAG